MSSELVVAIAAPLEPELVEVIRAVDRAVEVLYDPGLLPPERFPADHTGDPKFTRSAVGERRYWQMLERADALYGFPSQSAAGLAAVVKRNGRLRWVHSMAAGAGATVKAANLDAGDLDRVVITTSAGVHAIPLAEFAVFGALAGLKGLPLLLRNQQAKIWPQLRAPARPVQGARIVVAGLGEIGREVARQARSLGMRVSGTKRRVEEIAGVDRVATNADLVKLVAHADVLVNTLPGTPQTELLINDEVLNAMPDGAVVVNVGRGTVIDEVALIDALDEGKVAFACLDVFGVEPLPGDSPLWAHPRVLVSPHTAALSVEENRLIAEQFASYLRKFIDGDPLPHRVDPIFFY